MKRNDPCLPGLPVRPATLGRGGSGYGRVHVPMALAFIFLMTVAFIHPVNGYDWTSSCGCGINENDCQELESEYIQAFPECSRCIASNGVDACIDSPACERSEQCYAICTECISSDSALVRKYDLDCQACGCPCAGASFDPTWIVVIGAIGVAGAVAGVLIMTGYRKVRTRQDQERKDKEKQAVTYILQVNTDRVTVGKDRPADIEVAVWKQAADGPLTPAPEAIISIQVPQGYPGLKVAPASGQGTLAAKVTVEAPVPDGEIILEIVARAAGTSKQARVTVKFDKDSVMEIY